MPAYCRAVGPVCCNASQLGC
uniref:Uncharacterized protein n=1 Tax=Anguilla anguilla TaxID=7936 RepID=A0A0E9R1E4_ANGAN